MVLRLHNEEDVEWQHTPGWLAEGSLVDFGRADNKGGRCSAFSVPSHHQSGCSYKVGVAR